MGSRKLVSQRRVDLIPTLSGVNTNAVIPFLEALDDGDGLCFKGLNPLFHGFRIIITAATGLAPLSHAVNEGLGGAFKINEVPDNDFICQPTLELLPVFLVPGKSVKQVPSVSVS